VYVAEKYYTQYGGALGELLTSEILDPANSNFYRDWQYYDNAATDGAKFGKLKRLYNQRTGNWEKYDYDSQGRLSKTVSQFKSNPVTSTDNENRVTEYSYSSIYFLDNGTLEPRTPRTITEKLLGLEIVRSQQAVTPTNFIEWPFADPAPSPGGSLILARARITPVNFDGIVETTRQYDNTYIVSSNQYRRLGQNSVSIVNNGSWNFTLERVEEGTRTTTTFDSLGRITSAVTVRLAAGVPVLTLSQETRSYGGPADPIRTSSTLTGLSPRCSQTSTHST
jgi:hypothetical protein